MIQENRRAPRYPLANRVDVYFDARGIWETQGVNLSSTGILFKSRVPLGLYTKAVLRIHLDGSEKDYLDLEAAALRSEVRGEWFFTAMEFLEMDEQEKQRLEAWTQKPLAS